MASAATPQEAYDSLVRKGVIEGTKAQRDLAEQCMNVFQNRKVQVTNINLVQPLPYSAFAKQVKNSLQVNSGNSATATSACQGVYIHGGVGVGKTMIMDLFELAITEEPKRRVHLHSFMSFLTKELHKETTAQQYMRPVDRRIPMETVARRVVQETPILCFDEFQTFDVTHASLLASFFTYAFQFGVFVIATSNKEPSQLMNLSSSFDAFVPMLYHHMAVIELDGADQRNRSLNRCDKAIYRFPNSEENSEALYKLVSAGFRSPPVWRTGYTGVSSFGRELVSPMFTDGVVMYRFSNLCTEAAMFGPTDFQLIARTFHTVILLDVPQIGAVSKNCAKQFVILVDELYQHNVKLCMTTGVPWGNMFETDAENPDERDYYTQGEDERTVYISETSGSFRTHEETLSFDRIASRLTEMSTMEYLLNPHTEFVVSDFDFEALVGELQRIAA
jgi:predicted ATPase